MSISVMSTIKLTKLKLMFVYNLIVYSLYNYVAQCDDQDCHVTHDTFASASSASSLRGSRHFAFANDPKATRCEQMECEHLISPTDSRGRDTAINCHTCVF